MQVHQMGRGRRADTSQLSLGDIHRCISLVHVSIINYTYGRPSALQKIVPISGQLISKNSRWFFGPKMQVGFKNDLEKKMQGLSHTPRRGSPVSL